MKKIILASCVLLYSFTTFSQALKSCGNVEARERLLKEFPENIQAEKDAALVKPASQKSRSLRSQKIILPIVFHIIHQAGSENISDAQVINQVKILNIDYNKENADTIQVVPAFDSIIANVGVEFRLATLDPNGNCTNGIERVYSMQTYEGNDFSKLHGWPREKYLNVWIVAKMMSGAAGYAYLPKTVNTVNVTRNMDGIIILQNYIGSIGTSNPYTSRALTHEIGHFLNLDHTWGSDNNPGQACGDDGVFDTPITKGSTTCNVNLAVCDPLIIENVQNYMDYSYCSKMFTEGQKERMLDALNSPLADRINLWADSNLIATGVFDSSIHTPCAPIADIAVNRKFICENGNVTFTDVSYNGTIDDRLWTFQDGIPATSTDPKPVVQFTTFGWHQVTLWVNNAQGSSEKTDTFSVYVSDGSTATAAPYFESFEDPATIPDWTLINYDNNRTKLARVNTGAHWGNNIMKLDNYFSYSDHDIDEMISPAIDLGGLDVTDLSLSFYYSLATFNDNAPYTDSLVISANIGCSNLWSPVYKSGGGRLVNAGYWVGPYTPERQEQFWKYLKITLPQNLQTSSVRFKFQFWSSRRGNNWYIDDINIGNAQANSIHESAPIFNQVSLYPNPTQNNASLTIETQKEQVVSVLIVDALGREVCKAFEGKLQMGQNNIALNLEKLAGSGIYTVAIHSEGNIVNRKLVVTQ